MSGCWCLCFLAKHSMVFWMGKWYEYCNQVERFQCCCCVCVVTEVRVRYVSVSPLRLEERLRGTRTSTGICVCFYKGSCRSFIAFIVETSPRLRPILIIRPALIEKKKAVVTSSRSFETETDLEHPDGLVQSHLPPPDLQIYHHQTLLSIFHGDTADFDRPVLLSLRSRRC
jgi:hypothetical protein